VTLKSAPITQASLNDDVMKLISLPGKIWWTAFLLDLTVLAVALAAVRNLIVHGWVCPGSCAPSCGPWTSPTSSSGRYRHCGTLVSAVLFLFRSHFRRAVYRIAEAMTVFGVLTAAMFPATTPADRGSTTGSSRTPTSAACGPTCARRSSGTCSRSTLT